MNTKLTKEEILKKLEWLYEIKIKDDSYGIAFGAAMVLHDLKPTTGDIDIFVTLKCYIWILFRYIFDRTFIIPEKVSIFWKISLRTPLKTEKLYGYNVQTLESLKNEKTKRNRINDVRDIPKINEKIITEYGFPEYKIAHLLGRTRNNEELFRHVEKVLTMQGYICFAPVVYDLDEYLKHADLLDSMCYQKLLMTDICVIVSANDIGVSTNKRIEQCKEFKIPLYIFENDQLIEYDYHF